MPSYKEVSEVIEETAFWLRLGTLLHGPLTQSLLFILHNEGDHGEYVGLPRDPVDLYKFLKKNEMNFQEKYSKEQILLLLPTSGKTLSDYFDSTLIISLIRKFIKLPAPLSGWKSKTPTPEDNTVSANYIRAREWRNYLIHTKPNQIDEVVFDAKWDEGARIVTNIGFKFDMNALKNETLDPKSKLVTKANVSLKHLQKLPETNSTIAQDIQFVELKHESPHRSISQEFKSYYNKNHTEKKEKNIYEFGERDWFYIKKDAFKLGKGVSSDVYLGYKTNPKEWVAVKVCKFHTPGSTPQEIKAMREVSIANHHNIVNFLKEDPKGYKGEKYRIALGLHDYSLDKYLEILQKDGKPLQDLLECYCSLAKQLLEGLQFLHSRKNPIVHRDLKPNNVMIDVKEGHDELRLIIVDFGISREVGRDATRTTSAAGNPAWSFPGAFIDANHDDVKQINDVFSAAMLLVYIFSGGQHPFIPDKSKWEQGITLDEVQEIDRSVPLHYDLKRFLGDVFKQFYRFYKIRKKERKKNGRQRASESNEEKEERISTYNEIFGLKEPNKLLVSKILTDLFSNPKNQIYCIKNPRSTLGRRYSITFPCNKELTQGIANASGHSVNLDRCNFKPIVLSTNNTEDDILTKVETTISNDIGGSNEDIYMFVYLHGHGSFDKKAKDSTLAMDTSNTNTEGFLKMLSKLFSKGNANELQLRVEQFLSGVEEKLKQYKVNVHFLVAIECCQLASNQVASKPEVSQPQASEPRRNALILRSSTPGTVSQATEHALYPSPFSGELLDRMCPGAKVLDVFKAVEKKLQDDNFLKLGHNGECNANCAHKHKENCFPQLNDDAKLEKLLKFVL